MPRMSRRVDDVQKEFSEDFTVVNDNLLLCKVKNGLSDSVLFENVWLNLPRKKEKQLCTT